MSQRHSSMQRAFYRCARRHGMTIIEMLVAMTLSLIIILAVTQAFRIVGDSVLASRAVTEMSSQLRATSDLLRSDLSHVTVQVRPWTDYSSGQGYLEYYEGPFWDMGIGMNAAVTPVPPVPRDRPVFTETSVGDFDDVLMFTARSHREPFTGQILDYSTTPPTPLVRQSKVAEIAWFTRFDDKDGDAQPDPGEVTLHRRTLLILPELNVTDPADGLPILNIGNVSGLYIPPGAPGQMSPEQFYHAFDISVGYRPRINGSGQIAGWVRFANSLENLSLRENRTAHRLIYPVGVPAAQANAAFPFFASRYQLRPQGTTMNTGLDGGWGVDNVPDFGTGTDDLSDAGTFGSDDRTPVANGVLGEMYGNDVIQSQLLAFDVKLFDPTVAVVADANATDALLPGDPGFLRHAGEPARVPAGQGGYVDLFYSRYTPAVSSTFSGAPHVRSGLGVGFQETIWGVLSPFPAIYDTWTAFYEHDGVDQDGNGIADQGTNGLDDDGMHGVDDVGERETSPPYPVPLRGLQVRIRIIDSDSRQVRQVTVSSSFVPE